MSFSIPTETAMASERITPRDVGRYSNMISEIMFLDSRLLDKEKSGKSTDAHGTRLPRDIVDTVEFDSISDTQYSILDERFSGVAHCFHQAWHGIRSAAGVLPGHKIAIPNDRPISVAEIATLRAKLDEWKIRIAIFHGFSFHAQKLLRCLVKFGIDCYLVWHGNFAQLAYRPEIDYFRMALEEAKRGHFRRMHVLKGGESDQFPRSFKPLLLNSPPVLKHRRVIFPFSTESNIALVPGHLDIRKNVYSSLIGTINAKSLNRIFFYFDMVKDIIEDRRAERVSYRGHDAHLKFLFDVDIVVNVTVIDCHPMVDQEALAAGAMALTGPLWLDALTRHQYTKLSEIENPFDVNSISKRIDFLAGIDGGELAEMIADYVNQLRHISVSRYVEYCNL